MNLSFQKLLVELETQREKIIESVRNLTEEQLNSPLAPGKWSASQILSHLIAAERLSLQYLQKKIQGINEAVDSGLWEEVKINLLKISQRLPGLKFKAPQRVLENTASYRDMATIQREWDNLRSELKSLLETIQDQHINRTVYRHPLAGYLNIKHCLIFFREHAIHHTPQIKKLANQK